MSVSAGSAFGVVKLFYLHKLALLVSGYNHLGYTLACLDGEVFVGEVYKQHTKFATVVGVDCSG